MRGAVHELQQLDGELDVGQRAAAELQVELRVVARADALALDAGLHAPDLADLRLRERVAVHERRDELEEAVGDLGVAGDEPGAQQRLELPRQRPPLVVALVAAQRARERALLALGSQVRVDAEHPPLRRSSRRAPARDAVGEPFGRVELGGPSPS